MTDYRKDGTGCAHARLVASEDGTDSKRLCSLGWHVGDMPDRSEWRPAAYCAACAEREVPR